MHLLSQLNARLSRWIMYAACVCLAALLAIVVYGVVLRYVFNDAPAYVEQLALLLVIAVAMFGASAGVRDAGHIGLDSVVKLLTPRLQTVCQLLAYLFVMAFALALLWGGVLMAQSNIDNTIPTLGVSSALRYLPVVIAGALIALFSVERIVALVCGTEVERSWH